MNAAPSLASTDSITPTGADLAVIGPTNVHDPKALICIQHGMAEHAQRYGRFQDALAESGYASVVHDHRGHGLTTAGDASLGHFAASDGWSKVTTDALAVADHASRIYESVPLFVFGHSMGGVVAADLAIHHSDRFTGAAIWNIGFRQGALGLAFRALLRMERFRKGSDVPSALARKLTFEAFNKAFAPNRTAFDWLSRDKDEVDAYVADPACGHEVTIGLWLDVLEGMQRCSDDEPLGLLPKDMPFHILGGGADPLTENGKATIAFGKRLRAAGLRDVTTTVLENTRHEALNEVNRGTTTRSFIEWLDKRFADGAQ